MRYGYTILTLMMLAGCARQVRVPEGGYDLLLKGGHVIDPRNRIDGKSDVAIAAGKIARVAEDIPAADAKKVADVTGLYVMPGLIDLHAHVYASSDRWDALTGAHSVYPDGFSFRSCVTTQVDAGTSGWRNFEDFKDKVIDRSKTRVLALLNIVALGMGGKNEQDTSDMEPAQLAAMAKKHPTIVVGIKTAHYGAKDWTAVENAVKAGMLANIPVMVDFGANHPERPIRALFLEKLRPGDIYTHAFSGLRNELGEDGKLNPAMTDGRKRGIIFDVGHGGGSFVWKVAKQAFKEGFWPDTISTDLHTGSMNGGMKDMTNIMSKILSSGASIQDVVKMSTDKPAQVIKQTQLGSLSEGAEADVAVLRVDQGQFGFIDVKNSKASGDKFCECELTLRKGVVSWDLNGRTAESWESYLAKHPRGKK